MKRGGGVAGVGERMSDHQAPHIQPGWIELDDEIPEATAMLVWLENPDSSSSVDGGMATFGRFNGEHWEDTCGSCLEIDGWVVTHYAFEPSGPRGLMAPPNEGDGDSLNEFGQWFACRDLLRIWHDRRVAGLIDDPRATLDPGESPLRQKGER